MQRSSTRFLALLASLFLAGCGGGETPAPAGGGPSTPAAPTAPVNVILILVDTLRADAVLDPEGQYDTPNLDRFAQEGIVFPRAFASAPMTLPSHVSLFSSRPPLETKVLNNNQTVPTGLPLVAEWFRQHDYDTRAVLSLATMNPPVAKTGVSRGFASYDVNYWMMSRAEDTAQRLWRSLDARDGDAPLFLFAHFSDPHEPYNSHGSEQRRVGVMLNGVEVQQILASDWSQTTLQLELPSGRSTVELKTLEKPARRFRVRMVDCKDDEGPVALTWEQGKEMERVTNARLVLDRGERDAAICTLRVWVNDVPDRERLDDRYRGEVAYVDRYVGELIQKLKDLGLYEDSLVVFTSDHGEALGERNFVGHVEYLTDEMIHVPLIVKPPRGDARRAQLEQRATSLVSHLDLVPTLLSMAGLPPLPGQRGKSLLEANAAVHIAETHKPEAKKNQIALRDGEFKMIYFADEERFEMYDLALDPGEKSDVYASQSGRRKDWPEKLVALYQESQVQADASQAGHGEVDPALLKALGYGGGDED